MDTSQCFLTSDIKSWINFSGAEAPDVKPIVFDLSISFIGSLLLKSNNSDFLQPDFLATSTNLFEFEEFSLPITKNKSQFGAIFLTEFCLFVVA